MMDVKDYFDIAQAIYDVETYDNWQLEEYAIKVAKEISYVMDSNDPDFVSHKFLEHALKGIEYKGRSQ